MPQAQVRTVEGPALPPTNSANVVGVIGWAKNMAVGDILAANRGAPLLAAAGYGYGTECAYRRAELAQTRVVLIKHAASYQGQVGAVSQTGPGPALTIVANDANGPLDAASLVVRIAEDGAPGAGSFAVSWGYDTTVMPPARLFGTPITIPPRVKATVTGTVDLRTLDYATQGTITGTLDITNNPDLYDSASPDYLDGLTVIVSVDGALAVTVTLSMPENSADVAAQITTALGVTATASITLAQRLQIASASYGASSSVEITGGTALALLGLSVGSQSGDDGDLDGLTLIVDEDTTTAQTVTFALPTSVDDMIAQIRTATTNVDVNLYSSSYLLQLRSSTEGASSRLSVTGGTALALLGLSVTATPEEGAEASYEIPHLGVTLQFAPGLYRSGSTYSTDLTVPHPDIDEVLLRIDDLARPNKNPYPVGSIHIATEFPLGDTVFLAQACAQKLEDLEAAGIYISHVTIGFRLSEADADLLPAIGAFRSRRITLCARGAYLTTGGWPAGGGAQLRSQSWPAGDADAIFPYYADRGDHSRGPMPGVLAITKDENDAAPPLVNDSGVSLNVMDSDSAGYHFAGGYTLADATSRYRDLSTQRVVTRGAQLSKSALDKFVNVTDLDTNADGTLQEPSAVSVDGAVENALAELVPAAAQAVKCTTDRTINFDTTKRLGGKIEIVNRVPARSVEFTIAPTGAIQEG